MRVRRCVAAFAVVGLWCVPAMGQAVLERFERQLEQIQRQHDSVVDSAIPAGQRALLDYGGFVTFSLLSIDDINQSSHMLRQTDLNGYARLNFDDAHQFFVRGRYRYQDFNTGDSFDGEGDEGDLSLERAFYRFDLRAAKAAYEAEALDWNLTVQGGRQLVHWFNGLVLSRDIDGGVVTYSNGPFEAMAVAGITRKDQFDIDSSRPNFDDNTLRGIFGGVVSYQVADRHRPFLYGLVQRDQNEDNFDPDSLAAARAADPATFVGVPLIPTEYEYNSWYIGGGSSGSITDQLYYSVEAAYEGGDTLSNSFFIDGSGTPAPLPQTEDDISAWALDGRLDYLMQDANKTRLTFEVLLASGDDDRGHTTNTFTGNQSGTNDNAFNGFGLINTGLAFSPNVSNLLMIRGGASTFPVPSSELFKRMQVGFDAFWFAKLDEDAPITEPTRSDSDLGFETDLFVNWQVTSDVSIGARYGIFFPRSAILTDRDARHFAFMGITYSF